MEKYIHKIQYYETDKMGVTHHSNYVRFMEEARIDFLTKAGYGYDKLESIGLMSPVIEVNGEYKKSTTFNDELVIDVKIKDYNGVRITFLYEMQNLETGEIVFCGESKHCFISGSGVPKIIKREFPEIHERIMKIVSDGGILL